MNVFRSLKRKISWLIRNEFRSLVYSAVIAIFAWFLISVTIYPTTPKTIRDIPLTISLADTAAEENGLSIITEDLDQVKVDVTITGSRSQIGSFTAENLVAEAVIPQSITEAGEYTLSILVTNPEGVAFTVDSQSPKTIDVTFDRIQTVHDIPVQASLPNVTAAENLTLDTQGIECTPEKLSITGPATTLELIDHAVVNVPDTMELSSTYTFTNCTNVMLYDKDGAEIDQSALQLAIGNGFNVKVPVFTKVTLPLDVSLTYVPTGFDTEFLRNRLKFSIDEITLAAQNSNIKDLTSWNLGSIVLSTVDLHYQKTFEIDTRGQFNNLSGITTVQVALDTEGLASKTIRVTDIPVVNAPSSYKYSVVTRSLSITVIGPEEDIKDLTEKDLLVTADLTGYSVKDASFEHEVTVTAPDYSKVWASGSYTVWIDAERNNEE